MNRILASCLALLVLAACENVRSTTAPSAAGTPAQLQVNVIDAATNSGIANVTVNVRQSATGPVAYMGTTNASGAAAFTVAPGTYWVDVLVPAGYAPSNVVTASQAQLTVGSGGSASVTIKVGKR